MKVKLNGAKGLDQLEQGVFRHHKADQARLDHPAAPAPLEYVSYDDEGGDDDGGDDDDGDAEMG